MAEEAKICSPTDLTIDWLSSKVGVPVLSFQTERIGTGQVSECHRVCLEYSNLKGPPTLVLKVPSQNQNSKKAALLLGLYRNEVLFYSEIAPQLSGAALAPVYHAAYYNDASFSLLLGDASPAAVVGNELSGCSIDQARIAMRELGTLHSSTINNKNMASSNSSWLQKPKELSQPMLEIMYQEFLERYEKRVKPEHLAICSRVVESFQQFTDDVQETSIQGLVHGDYRLDNLLFTESAERELTIVDWQTVTWGDFMTDATYFLGCALDPETRRQNTDELLEIYHKSLGSSKVTLQQCKEGLVRQAFFGVIMAIVSPIFVERTDRGDELFMTLIHRHCEHVIDLKALSILPSPVILEPLAPEHEDEGTHSPQIEERLWQESWYFDFADLRQNIGGWIRAGVDPARNRTWYTALFAGPGRPTIAVVDFQAPLPLVEDALFIKTPTWETSWKVDEPLKSCTVVLNGTGRSYSDPSTLLDEDSSSNKSENETPVSLKLTWKTDGTPYKYRIATRYEIPCSINGILTLGSETFSLESVPGQRDHSWGGRDWWAMDWIWSSLHFTDGTHIHGTDLRIPSGPRLSIGYVQNGLKGKKITELSLHAGKEEFDANNKLPTGTKLTVKSRDKEDHFVVEMEMLGHAPLRLESDEGLVAMFPRAWGKVKTDDGREGVAWMEWNRNLR